MNAPPTSDKEVLAYFKPRFSTADTARVFYVTHAKRWDFKVKFRQGGVLRAALSELRSPDVFKQAVILSDLFLDFDRDDFYADHCCQPFEHKLRLTSIGAEERLVFCSLSGSDTGKVWIRFIDSYGLCGHSIQALTDQVRAYEKELVRTPFRTQGMERPQLYSDSISKAHRDVLYNRITPDRISGPDLTPVLVPSGLRVCG